VADDGLSEGGAEIGSRLIHREIREIEEETHREIGEIKEQGIRPVHRESGRSGRNEFDRKKRHSVDLSFLPDLADLPVTLFSLTSPTSL
jgi:hypothetical protein